MEDVKVVRVYRLVKVLNEGLRRKTVLLVQLCRCSETECALRCLLRKGEYAELHFW